MKSSDRTASRTWSTTDQSALVQTAWIAGFAALTAVGARVEIPHQPVPFTLQTLVVLLAGAFLGPRNGSISQVLYLAAGAAGLPVFAGGALGVVKLFGPTGGYLLAFPAAAALVGYLVTWYRTRLWIALSMTLGLLVIFTSGTIHLWVFYMRDASAAITSGFLLFTWWDLLKLGAASMIYFEFAKRWPRIGE